MNVFALVYRTSVIYLMFWCAILKKKLMTNWFTLITAQFTEDK